MNDPSYHLPQPVTSPADEKKSRRKKSRIKLSILFPLVMLILAGIGFGAVFGPGPFREAHTIVIPTGDRPREIANVLYGEGVIYDPYLFRAVVKFMANNALKAGEYEITAGQSMAEIVQMIHEGHSITRLFKVAEGLTSSDIAKMLNADPTLGGDPVNVPPEGSLLPESYRYIYGDNRAGVVTRMQKAMDDLMNEQWPKRDMSITATTPEQALVMASIIEKETGKGVERARIAGVFYNRLREEMRLQSDPTVIYGITLAKGGMDHELNHDDLGFVSPYNTYTNDGLPPHPICNPGRAAIEAALHPEHHNFLYFVADGTGGHAFARNLTEHNANVTKWNAILAKRP